MLIEFHIISPESCYSLLMYWRVASNYELKRTALTRANTSVGIKVSNFTQTVPQC